MQDQAAELVTVRNIGGDSHGPVVRFQQVLGNIPIMGAELIVHLDRAGDVLSIAGETLPPIDLDPVPTTDGSAAIEAAIDVVAISHGVETAALAASPPQLWVYVPDLLGPHGGPARLVWRTEVQSRELLPIRELVLVDARRGSVALHFNQVHTARNRETYTTNNTTTLPGTLLCNETNPTCAGGDADAAAAHIYAGDTYDFYLANHGRDSLNNAGLTLRSTVHYGPVGYQNAFWNGAQMAYGDGFSLADDVVGHELTHGVTDFTSSLFYYYQSGAINESLSDVFGEFIDQTNGRGNDASGVRWLLSEDIPGVGAIRNLQNPPAFGHPDRITSSLYFLGEGDNGGVHFNSGVNNKAAYLMVDGGTFNGQTITGIGLTKVAKIYYEVQTHLLTSGADYNDLFNALFQGCNNLIGSSGITTADCTQVRNATLAVEMNLQPVPGFNPDAAVCAVGQTPVNLFFDDLENGPSRFAASSSVGTVRWRYDSPHGPFAHSGLHFLFADDFPAATTDTSVALVTGVPVSSNTFLHFAHAFGYEPASRDGGVLEYSINNGATWIDAGPLFDQNGYNGVIASGFGNPLAGRPAFIGASHGYISSRLNLAPLAGQTVRFRWRMALDSAGFNWGWWLDDVRIYTCGGPQLTQVTPALGHRGQTNLNVSIAGESTHFVQGFTTGTFGPGITINGMTVIDATHAIAHITIASTAALGVRDVILTTNGEVAAKLNGFTVTPAPLLSLVVPNNGQPGANLTVSIKGQFTHFAQGSTTVSFGPGIVVNNTTVTDATRLTVNLTISGAGPLGTRNVSVATGAELVTLSNGFVVNTAPVDVPAFAYVVGRRLSPSQGGTNGIQTVSVIDTSTNIIMATIPAGQGCSCVGADGIAVTPDGSTVYVPNELENTVSVINTATNAVTATIPVGNGPIAVAAGTNGDRVYVVNGSGATSVSVINTATNAILVTIPLGVIQARGIAISPNGNRLYVSTYGSNSIKVIDTTSNTIITTIPVGNLPLGVDVSPNGSLVYVANVLGGSVSVISAVTNTVVATIPVGPSPYSARFTPDGGRAYVANSGANFVSVINTQTNAVVATVPLHAYALEFTPEGGRAYLLTATGSNVRVVNTVNNAVILTFPLNPEHGLPLSVAMSAGPTRVISLSGNLAFGYVRPGLSASATLTITNSGNSPLTVTSLGLPPGFSTNWAGGTIPAGASVHIPVTFAPSSSRRHGGSITVNGNMTGGTAAITVSGFGSSDSSRRTDYDGDGTSDIAVFRPSSGAWYILTSGSSFTGGLGYTWGASTDVPVPGDYDGDGRTDVAVYRPSSGHWFILKSSDNYATWLTYQWGGGADVPVPGDYDGDARTDIVVFRPSSGHWIILHSNTNFTTGSAYQWGGLGDVGVPGDYDGDGLTDLALFRPASGHWFVRRSSTGYADWITLLWGGTMGDIPVPGDYDGDGTTDVAVHRRTGASSTRWVLPSGTGFSVGLAFGFGTNLDLPQTGDFDGDGRTDVTVFRAATGQWFVNRSSSNYNHSAAVAYQWGFPTDLPLPPVP